MTGCATVRKRRLGLRRGRWRFAAFLAPKLVRAAVGRLPRDINIAQLRDSPAEWCRQFVALGLNPQQ